MTKYCTNCGKGMDNEQYIMCWDCYNKVQMKEIKNEQKDIKSNNNKKDNNKKKGFEFDFNKPFHALMLGVVVGIIIGVFVI